MRPCTSLVPDMTRDELLALYKVEAENWMLMYGKRAAIGDGKTRETMSIAPDFNLRQVEKIRALPNDTMFFFDIDSACKHIWLARYDVAILDGQSIIGWDETHTERRFSWKPRPRDYRRIIYFTDRDEAMIYKLSA